MVRCRKGMFPARRRRFPPPRALPSSWWAGRPHPRHFDRSRAPARPHHVMPGLVPGISRRAVHGWPEPPGLVPGAGHDEGGVSSTPSCPDLFRASPAARSMDGRNPPDSFRGPAMTKGCVLHTVMPGLVPGISRRAVHGWPEPPGLVPGASHDEGVCPPHRHARTCSGHLPPRGPWMAGTPRTCSGGQP